MDIDFQKELSVLFSGNQRVIDDDFKFKAKLGIGDEGFDYLRKGKNLADFFESVGGGVSIGSIVAANLGWNSIWVTLGLTSNPVGWVVGAGALGAAGIYGLKKAKDNLVKKAEDNLMTKIPKYLKTPLDCLGLSVANLFLPIAIETAKSDGDFCEAERTFIANYLVDVWGFSEGFILEQISALEAVHSQFSYDGYLAQLRQSCEGTEEFKFDKICSEILKFQKELILADGKVEGSEISAVEMLQNAIDGCLKKDKTYGIKNLFNKSKKLCVEE